MGRETLKRFSCEYIFFELFIRVSLCIQIIKITNGNNIFMVYNVIGVLHVHVYMYVCILK